MRMRFHAALGLLLFSLAGGWLPLARAAGDASAADLVAQGRSLYLEGRRADGRPLVATRAGGLTMSGPEGACVSCHRRSGMGGSEGRSYIPPVNAAALSTAMPAGKGPSALGDGRPAYEQATLARALREGVDAAGRRLDYLMPRYQLDDQEVRALQAYLATLPEAPPAPGGTVHFATVVAPDVPAERSAAMLGVLQACVAEHNAGPQPERGRKKLAAPMSKRGGRKWALHAWHLEGPPEGWSAQLAQRAAEQPVFALVGGIGGARWEPVHGFCEREGVPCLFPHLEAAAGEAGSFYPLYLGQGAVLEAGLVARHLAQHPGEARHVTQVLRAHDASAQAAAAALTRALAELGVATRELRLAAQEPLDARSLAAVQAGDTLVLWLRPQDLERLQALPPVAGRVFLSATLAQRDDVVLGAAWKSRTLLAYPYELPQKRARSEAALRRWLQERGLALVDERVQADAWVACKALRIAMLEAEDHLGRDYLVERVETNLERTTATGLYPRLALGTGQRLASKTGYIVRFDEATGGLVAVGERMAP